MSNQLFRFSVLRGPDPSTELTPIVVQKNVGPVDDHLAEVAATAARWIRSVAKLNATTVSDFGTALALNPAKWTATMAPGLVSLAKRDVIEILIETARSTEIANRRKFSDSTDFLTAAALVAEFPSLAGETSLADWIAKHPIQIDFQNILPANLWRPKQALVREPAVCDHFVVREELVGYEMGEIEDIKSYLRGELKDHSIRFLTVNEREVVNEVETEDNRTTETATQQRSSMKAASQKTANSSVGLDARVKTDGQYGPTKVSTDVGFQYSSTTSEASQTAAEFSTDVLQKSVEEVRDRELTRITTRTKTELEEIRDHKVDNVKGADHLIGIYRWVNSRWKATTYGVGLRLVLEFLIPEPGRPVLLSRQPVAAGADATRPPDLPADLFNTIDAAQAAKLAMLYGVDGIKAQPLTTQVIGVPFGTTEYKDSSGDRVIAIVVKDVKIPDNYIGKRVIVAVTAMDRADVDHDSNIVIDCPGAGPAKFLNNPTGPDNPFMVTAGLGRPTATLRTLVQQRDYNWGPGATVPVTIYAEDVRGVAGTVEVVCDLSPAALDEWKLDTVQKITAAYRTRLSEWQSSKLSQSFDVPPPVPAPDLDALCRHACISSLLGKWPAAVPARNDANGWPVPGALAGKTGELIEFLEQAFEWSNLQYVAYPYYWADSKGWKTLLSFDDADSHVREFVRSGAVRMVVPVRLDLSEAVLFFLATGIPWFGGSAPIPGETGYLAIADEIRNSRVPSHEDFVVGEFEYSLPTSLTILQESGVLPSQP